MASNSSMLPHGFTDLDHAVKISSLTQIFDVVGVCVEIKEPLKCTSGKQDWKVSFTLHDPTWSTVTEAGMEFSFFYRDFDDLPQVKDQGDIVVLHSIRTLNFGGSIIGVNHGNASEWSVFPTAKLASINSIQDIKDKARWKNKVLKRRPRYPGEQHVGCPTEAELKYAKWLDTQKDPGLWPMANSRRQTGGEGGKVDNTSTTLVSKRDKCRTLQQLEIPNGSHHLFADLSGEVRRIHSNDFLTELYVTDYTTNGLLYDYRLREGDEGRTGDPYGYIKEESSSWPGPWGQMTINIRCRDGQSHLANTKVKPGDFVYVRNVQIKMDSNGLKIEGNCRDDPKYDKKEMIEVIKSKDERRLDVLRRKKAYEEKMEADGIRFFRDPTHAPSKRPRDEPNEAQPVQPNTKQSKNRKRKNKKAAKLENGQQAEGKSAPAQQERALATNPSIRIHHLEGLLCKTIVDILDPEILARKTAKGSPYQLPFQNCTYKSKVRVVDFFPDNIADFAAPRKVDQYDELSDHESSDGDSDVDLSKEWQEGQLIWKWRFILLVEDAKPQVGRQGCPTQMELLVADEDGDFLLDMEACNLRDKKNEDELAKLKEKLFHLWGDLQEKKEEKEAAPAQDTPEPLTAKPSARPFECLIKEYGVPIQSETESSGDVVLYDRMFRMFGTSI